MLVLLPAIDKHRLSFIHTLQAAAENLRTKCKKKSLWSSFQGRQLPQWRLKQVSNTSTFAIYQIQARVQAIDANGSKYLFQAEDPRYLQWETKPRLETLYRKLSIRVDPWKVFLCSGIFQAAHKNQLLRGTTVLHNQPLLCTELFEIKYTGALKLERKNNNWPDVMQTLAFSSDRSSASWREEEILWIPKRHQCDKRKITQTKFSFLLAGWSCLGPDCLTDPKAH